MPEIRVLLNREHPNYERIAGAIKKSLQALETVEIREITEPQEPGTLALDWPLVTGFVIQHGGQLLDLAKAIVEMTTAVIILRGAAKAGTPKKEKPAVITAGDKGLVLPASSQKKREFFANIAGKRTGSTYQEREPKRKTPTSKSGARRATPRKDKK